LLGAGLVASGSGGPGPVGAANVNPADLPADATWLQALNAWRSASDLTLVAEDTSTTPTWSEGAELHSDYIVETGTAVNEEDSTSPFFTVAGNDAGLNGIIATSTDAARTEKQFIEQWITAPFHAAGLLDPRLQTSGFGSSGDETATNPSIRSAATLDIVRGLSPNPATTTTVFPGDGSTLPVGQQSYRGGESPDPLSHCPGYNPGGGAEINTGTPLFALLPSAPMASTLTASVTRDGVAVESCAYDETSYTNPDVNAETLGRTALASRHQVVVIPRLPLVQGSTYAVSISVMFPGDTDPTVTTWDFVAEELPDVSIGDATVIEGRSRSRKVRFTVALSRPHYAPVTVDYTTVAGTATEGSDFNPRSGTITVPAGATAVSTAVPVKGDRVQEARESFTVQISNPTNATLGRRIGTGAIINDDVQATTVPQLSIGSASVVEGEAVRRPLKFAVTLSSPASKAVSVDWHTRAGGTASQSTDYAEGHGRLRIRAGETTGVVKVQIRPDLVNEPHEVFTVRLSDPARAEIYGADGYGTILDDD
jgi:hypothetical protein